MSEHSLFSNVGQKSLFRAILSLPPLNPGQCLRSAGELREWFGKSGFDIQSDALFGYTAGPPSTASPSDRDKPRILFDEQGRFLGIALWLPDVQNWSIAGAPGELKTVVRSANTVEEDMENKALFGWVLCDGDNAGAPDLKPVETSITAGNQTITFTVEPQPFFQGTAPDWDVYTVCKIA